MPFFFFKNKIKAQKSAKAVPVQPEGKVKVGLALGGGAARGYAHIGVIRAFEEEGIDFPLVAGTSVGSLVGALYSYGVGSAEMLRIAENLEIKDIRRKSIIPTPSDANNIGNLLIRVAGELQFSDLSKDFSVLAVDLITSREIIIDSGDLASAVSGSCAVPGVFRPVVRDGCHLTDGGLLNNIPSDVLRVKGADKVVAVDINSSRGRGTESLKLMETLAAAFRIMTAASSTKGLLGSDVVIRPDTKRFSATSKDGYAEMVEEGYLAAKEAIPTIKKLFETAN